MTLKPSFLVLVEKFFVILANFYTYLNAEDACETKRNLHMSRIGKVPIIVPEGIEIKYGEQKFSVKGPLGHLSMEFQSDINILLSEGKIELTPNNHSKKSKSLWGTYRSLIEQMILGVSQGYVTNLELVGVGYKASVSGKELILKVGFSHDIVHVIPDDIEISCIKPTLISIRGINKQLVNLEASRIRGYKYPEPYKGKGILYENEKIKLKEGKKK